MDLFEKKELRGDQMFKAELKDPTDASGKYLSSMRKAANKKWEKRLS